MKYDVKPNQDFLKFISIPGEKKNRQYLDLILNLNRNYPGMFTKVMSNFNKAQSFRKTLDENGKPTRVSWEEALKKFYLTNKYVGVSKDEEEMAELFGSKGLSQDVFDSAKDLMEKASERKVPEHILGRPLREETIIESIVRIKNQAGNELVNGKEMLEELFNKQFTYEWINKNDPHNAIMGLFCGCCGTISSQFYGRDIAKATLIEADVQNLVVRNTKGEIISKGTIYVNKEKQYAVINDFELNEQYRRHETKAGVYTVGEDSKDEQEREMIFKAFQRGINAFVEEYDKQNPEKPLKQINVGMGFNRLKRQVERLKLALSKLSVPVDYNFQDAMKNEQYIIYQRKENNLEKQNEGEER